MSNEYVYSTDLVFSMMHDALYLYLFVLYIWREKTHSQPQNYYVIRVDDHHTYIAATMHTEIAATVSRGDMVMRG